MIYAPPYLIRRRVEGEVDRTLASSPTVPGSTQDGKHWKANNGAPLLLRSNTRSRRQHNTTHYGIAPTVESGTNKLSGASVTHDEYRPFTVVFKLFSYR